VYTAAPHFHATEMPGVTEAKLPCQVTGPCTRALAGTGKASPVRKISSLPAKGTVVVHVFVIGSNDVDAQATVGSKVICAFGTDSV